MAFFICSSLASIEIPASVTSIGNYAFAGGDIPMGLQTVPFAPNSQLTSIGRNAFYSCSSLTTITIPASVTSIGDSAFLRCSGLPGITIPANVTSIGEYAFSECTSLTSIEIPAGVTSVGRGAFGGWTVAQTINVRGHASQATADTAWPGNSGFNWRDRCDATIKYWNGSEYL
jgi:hypothetical protein